MLTQLSLCFLLVSVGGVIDGHALSLLNGVVDGNELLQPKLPEDFEECRSKLSIYVDELINGSSAQDAIDHAQYILHICLSKEEGDLSTGGGGTLALDIVLRFVEPLTKAVTDINAISTLPVGSCVIKAVSNYMIAVIEDGLTLRSDVSDCYKETTPLTSGQLDAIVAAAKVERDRFIDLVSGFNDLSD